ncbi:MAG: glycosyl transferase family 28 [Acidiferrobacteraceae bacterium]|nr:glycosyl transferase family 28 [Acidiferrobacteraceae bacterium]MDP6397752.1 glycosyltransferase [Arenicellales bacterium]MDP6552479.1 glycosyltransferase [Arenicellales bacterium]MDP6853886.1 glycosyltransferase [Arenicellales bacterium]MDP6919622.1 glycosyltransferase [Arenicellales bacterium]
MILFYVQHLLGIGHLRRTAAIAQACLDQGLHAEVVSGGLPVDLDSDDALRIHQLEPLKSADLSFSQVVDRNGGPLNEKIQKVRADKLLEIFHEVRPQALVTELFPFGRRRFRFELLPLLEAAGTARTPVICSVRDSVQRRSREREAETIAWLRQYYEKVLIHGEERFIPFGDSFSQAGEIADLLSYTGFVDSATKTPGQAPLHSEPEVLVSAGGGSAGESLYLAAAEAGSLSRHQEVPWRILAGARPEPAFVARLRQIGGDQLTVEANRPDFRGLLGNCRLSVSQAGYNSVVDLLASGAPALLSPFTGEGGETEQPVRAGRLSGIGRAQVMDERDLDGGALAARIDALLDSGPQRFASKRCDGAAQTAKALKEYLLV